MHVGCAWWGGPTNRRSRGREASGGHLARNALGASAGERWVLLGIGGQSEGQMGAWRERRWKGMQWEESREGDRGETIGNPIVEAWVAEQLLGVV